MKRILLLLSIIVIGLVAGVTTPALPLMLRPAGLALRGATPPLPRSASATARSLKGGGESSTIPLLAEEGWLRASAAGVVSSAVSFTSPAPQISTGTFNGAIGIKIAVPEFQAAAGDASAAAL